MRIERLRTLVKSYPPTRIVLRTHMLIRRSTIACMRDGVPIVALTDDRAVCVGGSGVFDLEIIL